VGAVDHISRHRKIVETAEIRILDAFRRVSLPHFSCRQKSIRRSGRFLSQFELGLLVDGMSA
jgi:hypothetical protein